MNLKERKLIEEFIQREDTLRHNKATEILFYGSHKDGKHVSNNYSNAVRNAVRQCFSGPQYAYRSDEVYSTFVTEFYNYLIKIRPEKMLEIESLDKWLYRCARNFANSHRKKINETLGIIENETEFSSRLDIDTDEKEQLTDKTPDTSAWAEELLAKYIDQISCKNYRTVLRVVVLEGMDREDFAEELGISYTAINLLINHAMISLIRVALPDIRWRSRKTFTEHSDKLKDKDREMLELFFKEGRTENMEDLAKAVNRMMKISAREAKAEEKEEKRERREQKKLEKQKKKTIK